MMEIKVHMLTAIWHCDLMANLLKPDSKFSYFAAEFETCATFRHVSTGIVHTLVIACGLTKILT